MSRSDDGAGSDDLAVVLESLPVVGRAYRLGVNPVTTTVVLLGPVVIAILALVGRSPVTTVLGFAYVLSAPAAVAYARSVADERGGAAGATGSAAAEGVDTGGSDAEGAGAGGAEAARADGTADAADGGEAETDDAAAGPRQDTAHGVTADESDDGRA